MSARIYKEGLADAFLSHIHAHEATLSHQTAQEFRSIHSPYGDLTKDDLQELQFVEFEAQQAEFLHQFYGKESLGVPQSSGDSLWFIISTYLADSKGELA